MNKTLVKPSAQTNARATPNATAPARTALTGAVVLDAFRWLIYDTFRQALASRIFWIMLLVNAVCIVFCLGITVESQLARTAPREVGLYKTDNSPFFGESSAGSITLLYGFMTIPHARHEEDGVRFIQVILTGIVAGAIGFIMTLIWTAGFVPDFLRPDNASVLLAKPLPRWTLIVGKYLGVVAFVAFQIGIFFFGTWLALSLRTDVWDYRYLLCMPLFVVHFAVIFSFSVFVAVTTRSTIAAVFGSILFWIICWGINLGRHFTIGIEALSGGSVSLGAMSRGLIEAGYWILPKPADILMLQEQTLSAGSHFNTLSGQSEMQHVFAAGQFMPELSVLASLAFAVGLLFLSARQLAKTEY